MNTFVALWLYSSQQVLILVFVDFLMNKDFEFTDSNSLNVLILVFVDFLMNDDDED